MAGPLEISPSALSYFDDTRVSRDGDYISAMVQREGRV